MSTADPHARLEQSYRRLLWLFPPSYRRSRGRELLDVLMERADPGQRRPSPAESVALLRFSVRTWAWRALSPAPAAARDAMGLLAVVLPMLLLFPAATALYIDAQVGGFGMDELPFGVDIPAWLLWCVTAVLCLFGRPSWARWSASLGVVAYLAAQVVEYSVNNFQTVANALGWLGVQVIAMIALTSPAWVVRGRCQVRRWWAAAIGVTAAGAGLAVSSVGYPSAIDRADRLPVLAVAGNRAARAGRRGCGTEKRCGKGGVADRRRSGRVHGDREIPGQWAGRRSGQQRHRSVRPSRSSRLVKFDPPRRHAARRVHRSPRCHSRSELPLPTRITDDVL